MASSPSLNTMTTVHLAEGKRDLRTKSHIPRSSASVSLEKQGAKDAAMYRSPTLRARVPRPVLEGGNVGPFRRNPLRRMMRRLAPKAAVKVETMTAPGYGAPGLIASGLSASVLYAPDTLPDDSELPFAETELTSGPPGGNLVYTDSAFEIRVAGMLVRNYDRWVPGSSGNNELLMYSVQTDPDGIGSSDLAETLPYIHFDHRSDGYSTIERPNTYIPIPASKAYVTGSSGKPRGCGGGSRSESMKGGGGVMRSVNVQFRILELDAPSETVKQAISRIDELGTIISRFATTSPSLGILSPALSMAGSVSKQALDSYARPDKVIMTDMDFVLADRHRIANGTAPPGEYLRYGYYFFLNEPMEGKLYASVLTPKNVQLMLRRCDDDADSTKSRKFFPLTQVSYLVVRVCEPTNVGVRRRRPIHMAHARELEEIFSRAKSEEDPQKVKTAVKNLGKKLGVLDPDTDSSVDGESEIGV